MTSLVFNLVLIGIPLLFIGFWIFVTGIILKLAGWRDLERAYPLIDETPLIVLRMGSGKLGAVAMSNTLTLSVGKAGLQVDMWKIFRPFARAFSVPWHEVHVSYETQSFGEVARLGFGAPEKGSLMLDKTIWEKLAAYAPHD